MAKIEGYTFATSSLRCVLERVFPCKNALISIEINTFLYGKRVKTALHRELRHKEQFSIRAAVTDAFGARNENVRRYGSPTVYRLPLLK